MSGAASLPLPRLGQPKLEGGSHRRSKAPASARLAPLRNRGDPSAEPRLQPIPETLVPFPRQIGRAAVAAIALMSATACLGGTSPSTPSNPATETYATSLGVSIPQMTKLSDDLYVQDLTVGTGATAAAGKTIGVTYSGWLVNGTLFDSNVGKPTFSFQLGIGLVIPGWDAGVAGMKVGGKRRLVIGSALGYGPNANGIIPANSTLVFDVQLSSVQ